MAAAKAEKRSRSENIRVAQTVAHLLERARDRDWLRPADENPDEMAEGRIPELAPPFDLAGQEPRHVVAGRQLDGP